MKTARELFLCSALCLALQAPISSAPAQRAQEGPRAAALPSAREVVDRFVEVTNARKVIETTTSTHVKGKMSLPALRVVGPLEIWSAKPDRIVTQVDFGGRIGLDRSGHDGSVAWAIHPMSGPELCEGVELLRARLDAAYDSSLKSPELFESLRTVGRGTFAGKDCYQVEEVLKPLAGMDAAKTRSVRTRVEYYEVESGLLRGASGLQTSGRGNAPFTQTVSNYRRFGVQLAPTEIRIEVDGQEIVLTIESIEFDTVRPEVFALPPEIRKLVAARKAPAKL